MWVVSPTQGRGGHSVNGHNMTKRGSEGVLVKKGMRRGIYICEDNSLIIFLLVGINRSEKKENNFVILRRGFWSRRNLVICEVLLWAQRDKT